MNTNIDYQYADLEPPDFISGNIDVESVTEAKGLGIKKQEFRDAGMEDGVKMRLQNMFKKTGERESHRFIHETEESRKHRKES